MKLKKIFPFLFAIVLFFISSSDVFAYDFAHWKGATITDFSFRLSNNQWYTRSSTEEFVWMSVPDFGGSPFASFYQFSGTFKIENYTLSKGTATFQFALGYLKDGQTSGEVCSYLNNFDRYVLDYSTDKNNWQSFQVNSFNCNQNDGFVIIGFNVTVPNTANFSYLAMGLQNDSTSDNRLETLFTAVNIISSSDGTDAIINQNQTIIDQNNTQIQQGQETNENLNDIKDSITNDSVNGVENAFESFEGFISENSTITQLITMPITLYSAILNGLQSTCQPFVLGNLFGTNLTLPCINIGNYLGSSLWSMIDVIISGFAIYMISKKFIKIFNNFSSMKEGDVIDD